MLTLTFEPLISPVLWLTVALAAVVTTAVYSWRRPLGMSRRRWWGIVGLMTSGWAVVLGVLRNPTWIEPVPPPAGKPLLTVLLDESASMGTNDVDGRSRFLAGAEIAQQIAAEISNPVHGSPFEVQVRTFAARTRAVTPTELKSVKPEGQTTDLASAIAETLAQDRPQGQTLLLLSDGIHNGPGGVTMLLDVARSAKSMSIPVSAKLLGGDAQLDDLDVSLPRPQDLAFIGQQVVVPVVLRQRGVLSDRVEVVLRKGSEEIARQTAVLTPNAETTLRFTVQSNERGVFRYEIAAAALPRESVAENNTALCVVRVVDQPIHVLVLEGKPYWDTKFLLRTLSADPSLELDCVVRLTEKRFLKRKLQLSDKSDATDSPDVSQKRSSDTDDDSPSPQPSPPMRGRGSKVSSEAQRKSVRRVEDSSVVSSISDTALSAESLSRYQVIVLGRDSEVFLNEGVVGRLRNWIARDGGSLVCYRGSPVAAVSEQLAGMMPVRWSPGNESRFRMRLTDRGQSVDWLTAANPSDRDALSKLPSLAMHAKPERPKPLSVVLAQTGDAGPPVVTYQPYGTGRVVTIEGAGMWRWAFLAPPFREHDTLYGAVWQSLVRWLVSSVGLAPGQDLLLRTDKVTHQVGESVTALLLVREVSRQSLPAIELSRNDEPLTDQFSVAPLGDDPGVYQVSFGRLPEGRYRARIVGRDDVLGSSVAFDVRPFLGEQLDLAARGDILTRIVSETGGTMLSDVSSAEIGRRFREHLARSRPERTRRLTAWDRWWVFVIIVGLWTSAWTLRRSGGLV